MFTVDDFFKIYIIYSYNKKIGGLPPVVGCSGEIDDRISTEDGRFGSGNASGYGVQRRLEGWEGPGMGRPGRWKADGRCGRLIILLYYCTRRDP